MRDLKKRFIIPTVATIMLAVSFNSLAAAGGGNAGKAGQRGSNAAQSLDEFESRPRQYGQKDTKVKKFTFQEHERNRLKNQEKLLVGNRNRIAEMNSQQVKAKQQVRNQGLDVKQEGVRLQAQQQLTAGLKNQVKEQQRLLRMEANREKIQAMNLNRAQVQNQLRLLREQRSRVTAHEKLAQEEKQQLQERLRIMSQQRSHLAEQERLLNQQHQQVEERLRLMTQQQEMFQQRERLWTEIEAGES